MGDRTKIRWADATWNPMTGCRKVSPGCKNCYAYELAEARRGTPGFKVGFDPQVRTWRTDEPRKWREPRRVFVNSLSDLFLEDWTDAEIAAVFRVMVEEDRHTYQVLTKRPERMRDAVRAIFGRARVPRHIWLGVSIETDAYVGRADVLREVNVPTRFLSLEPLLGPLPSLDLEGIGWVIVGGESGPRFRRMDHAWARDLRDRCAAAKIPFFFKQDSHRFTERVQLLDGQRYEAFPPEPWRERAEGRLL